MTEKDGNVQDMPMTEKLLPSLAATEEAQDVSTLPQIVVPMPAFTDPSDPRAAQGSVNMALDEHPMPHSEDYAKDLQTGRDGVTSVIDAHAKEQAELVEVDTSERRTTPEDREEWMKADWQAQAREYNLSTQGRVDDIRARVEDHEAQKEEVADWKAGDWQDAIQSADSQEELDELRAQYGATDSDFKTVDSAFTAREDELANGS